MVKGQKQLQRHNHTHSYPGGVCFMDQSFDTIVLSLPTYLHFLTACEGKASVSFKVARAMPACAQRVAWSCYT